MSSISASFTPSGPLSYTNSPPISITELHDRLDKWCDQVKYTFEHSGRLNAAKEIKNCYATKSTSLDLRSNQLTALPAEIKDLTNLRRLDLRSNQLTTLPAEIKHLTKLTWLDLASNQLTALPAEIKDLSNLIWLYLEDNQLTALPAEIKYLTNLTSLNLRSNQLTALPAEIKYLTNLRSLDLCKNPIPNLDAAFATYGMKQTDMHSERCKVETTLVNRLLEPVQDTPVQGRGAPIPKLMIDLPVVGGHVRLWELIAEYATPY